MCIRAIPPFPDYLTKLPIIHLESGDADSFFEVYLCVTERLLL